MPPTELVEFVHLRNNKKKNIVGAVVATVVDFNGEPRIGVGWSRAHSKLEKKFDKSKGLQIAFNRAVNGSNKQLPHDVEKVYEKMLDRAEHTYKEYTFHPRHL